MVVILTAHVEMEFVGIGFDPSSLKQHRNILLAKLQHIDSEANEVIRKHRNSIHSSVFVMQNVLLTSPQQVSSVLVNELKLLSPATPSTGSKILKSLNHPFPQLVLRHRKISKYLSNWIDSSNFDAFAVKDDHQCMLNHFLVNFSPLFINSTSYPHKLGADGNRNWSRFVS